MNLNIARTLKASAANGPGERFVIWVQGCPLACPGCWNPDTWSFSPRMLVDVSRLVRDILETPGIEGVTFTGGEPFAQAKELSVVGRELQRAGLSVFVFSGYHLRELNWEAARELLSVTDVLVAGRYVDRLRSPELRFRGSSNQQIHVLSRRYELKDLEESADVEIHIQANGELLLTGFPEDALITQLGLPQFRRD